MQRVLLLDTNYSAAPIYDYLVAKGYEVFVAGGNPDDFLARTADKYLQFDYSDVTRTLEAVNSLQIQFIVPGCNDRSYLTCANINAERGFFGLDGIEVTETINNKERFRAFAASIGIPVPRVFFPQEAGAIWPIIVKPVDAYSGRGVTVLKESQADGLPGAIRQARGFSRTGACIIEAYVDGSLYSHSAFMSGSEIQKDFIVAESGSANPFVVDTSWVDSKFSENMLHRVRQNVSSMAKALGLVNGLIHTQFIAKDDSYWFIEVTRRCPGDLYAELIERATGFNYIESYVKGFLGRDDIPFGEASRADHVLRHTISLPKSSIFRSVEFKAPILVEKFVPLSLAGDTVKASPFGRIALVFARAGSQEELMSLARLAISRELYFIN